MNEVLRAAMRELLWQDREGRFFIGNGHPHPRKPPEVTATAVAALTAGLIEKRFAGSSVYRLTQDGHAFLGRALP